MEILQLRYFYESAKNENFTETAKKYLKGIFYMANFMDTHFLAMKHSKFTGMKVKKGSKQIISTKAIVKSSATSLTILNY